MLKWEVLTLKNCIEPRARLGGCQRKPRKMLQMLTKGGQRNKFIVTSCIGQVEY